MVSDNIMSNTFFPYFFFLHPFLILKWDEPQPGVGKIPNPKYANIRLGKDYMNLAGFDTKWKNFPVLSPNLNVGNDKQAF